MEKARKGAELLRWPGYGDLVPGTRAAYLVSTVEQCAGIMLSALLLGIVVSRGAPSQPTKNLEPTHSSYELICDSLCCAALAIYGVLHVPYTGSKQCSLLRACCPSLMNPVNKIMAVRSQHSSCQAGVRQGCRGAEAVWGAAPHFQAGQCAVSLADLAGCDQLMQPLRAAVLHVWPLSGNTWPACIIVSTGPASPWHLKQQAQPIFDIVHFWH